MVLASPSMATRDGKYGKDGAIKGSDASSFSGCLLTLMPWGAE
jgi:hypothetical protein